MKTFFLSATLFMLIGCEGSVSYQKIIQNNTTHDLWLIRGDTVNQVGNLKDSTLLTANNSFLVVEHYLPSASVDDYNSCSFFPIPGDTIHTRIDGNDSLNLSFVINENADWTYTLTKPAKRPWRSGSYECRLLINEADIE